MLWFHVPETGHNSPQPGRVSYILIHLDALTCNTVSRKCDVFMLKEDLSLAFGGLLTAVLVCCIKGQCREFVMRYIKKSL